MKKLFLIFPLLFALGACERDGGAEDSQSSVSGVIPRFYGAALPDDSSPATRGVANALKVWSRPIAKEQVSFRGETVSIRGQTMLRRLDGMFQ